MRTFLDQVLQEKVRKKNLPRLDFAFSLNYEEGSFFVCIEVLREQDVTILVVVNCHVEEFHTEISLELELDFFLKVFCKLVIVFLVYKLKGVTYGS